MFDIRRWMFHTEIIKQDTSETSVSTRRLRTGRLIAVSWLPILRRRSSYIALLTPVSPYVSCRPLAAFAAAATTTTPPFSPPSAVPHAARSVVALSATFRRRSTPLLAAGTRPTRYRSSPGFRKLNFTRTPLCLIA